VDGHSHRPLGGYPDTETWAGEYAAGLTPIARTRWYEGVGHVPFVECVEDFTADLATFARSVTTTKAGS
jgi:hypothetical protein